MTSFKSITFDETQWVLVRKDVVEFITGAKHLDGCWFNDGTRPLKAAGDFWWRKYLSAAPTHGEEK